MREQQHRPALTRVQVREIFQRHAGAQLALARNLEVSHVSITNWLRGRFKSARIEQAATDRALELLTQEATQGPKPVNSAAQQLLQQLIADGVLKIEGPKHKEVA